MPDTSLFSDGDFESPGAGASTVDRIWTDPNYNPERKPGESDDAWETRRNWGRKYGRTRGDDWSGGYSETSARQVALAREGYERAMSGKDSVAQQQMQAGVSRAQQAMAAQAVGRGSNPLAQRSAIYGGGQMAGQAVNQSAQLRAAETVAARGQYMDAYGQQMQGIQSYDEMRLARSIEEARQRTEWLKESHAEEERDRQFGLGVADRVMGFGGGMAGAGANSDMGNKQAIATADPGLQDRLIAAGRRYDDAPAPAPAARRYEPQLSYAPPPDDGGAGVRELYSQGGAAVSDRETKQKLARAEGENETLRSMAATFMGPRQEPEQAGGMMMMPETVLGPPGPGDRSRYMSRSPAPMQPAQPVERMWGQPERLQAPAQSSMAQAGRMSGEEAAAMAAYRAGQRPILLAGEGGTANAGAGTGSAQVGSPGLAQPYELGASLAERPVVSDEQAKQAAYMAGRQDEDAIIRGLKQEGARTDAQLGAISNRRDTDSAIGSMDGYTYEYTPEARAEYDLPGGERYGVMAQDVQGGSELGRGMVTETPQGDLAIDRDAALTGNMAMIGRLGERQDEEEEKRRQLDARVAELMAQLREGG